MAETDAALPASAVEATSVDEFAALLEKDFAPKSGEMRTEAHKAVQTLAEMALKKANLVPEEAVNQIKEMIEEIDNKLTDQINEILHHDDFQKLEGAWRGLAHLLGRSETGADLKIKVMPISKKELRKELARTADSEFDQRRSLCGHRGRFPLRSRRVGCKNPAGHGSDRGIGSRAVHCRGFAHAVQP